MNHQELTSRLFWAVQILGCSKKYKSIFTYHSDTNSVNVSVKRQQEEYICTKCHPPVLVIYETIFFDIDGDADKVLPLIERIEGLTI